jgi:hypothetical protein
MTVNERNHMKSNPGHVYQTSNYSYKLSCLLAVNLARHVSSLSDDSAGVDARLAGLAGVGVMKYFVGK